MATDLDETPDDGRDDAAARIPSGRPGTDAMGEPRLSLDGLFDVLRNERRRAVLRYLDAGTEPVDIGSLAEHIAALENDKPPELLRSLERKRVYVALYQFHLPKMAELGVIEFVKDRGRIAPGPGFDQARRYLGDRSGEPDDWPYRYLLTGVGLLTVVALTWLAGALPMARIVVIGGTLLLAAYSTVNWLEHVRTCRPPPQGR